MRARERRDIGRVTPGLVPVIHVFVCCNKDNKTWMPGTRSGMKVLLGYDFRGRPGPRVGLWIKI
jgi:hypothetical protein